MDDDERELFIARLMTDNWDIANASMDEVDEYIQITASWLGDAGEHLQAHIDGEDSSGNWACVIAMVEQTLMALRDLGKCVMLHKVDVEQSRQMLKDHMEQRFQTPIRSVTPHVIGGIAMYQIEFDDVNVPDNVDAWIDKEHGDEGA